MMINLSFTQNLLLKWYQQAFENAVTMYIILSS